MSSFGCWGLPAALLALLCCPGSGEETFEVHIWPEKLVVETSGSVEVNCSTSCAKPEKSGLETRLNKTLLKYDPQKQWAQFLVSNVSQDTVLLCHFTCNGKQLLKSLRVSVYQLPTQVILKLQPPRVVLGKPFTIECTVLDVKPLESLTLTLLRGKETLHNQTFGGAASAPQDATTTLNSTASTEDGLLSFSCQAELDLRPHGGHIIRSISEPQILEVYGFPGKGSQMVILITVVSVLLFLFVTSVLLCFVFGQHWHKTRTGTYRVLAAWRRLPRAFRTHPA